MIDRRYLLTLLSYAGIVCFYLAHKLYKIEVINDAGYFLLYAAGLLCWSVRMKEQSFSLPDKLVSRIILWLCVFNLLDEAGAVNPAAPYKPYIASIIVIIICVITFIRQCNKSKRV